MRRRRPPGMCRWIPSPPLPRLLVLLLVVEPLLDAAAAAAAAGDAAERWALLQFKASVSSDPAGLLSRWSDTVADHCSWPGVDCDGRYRVVSLNISAKGDAFLATCRRSGPVWRHCPDSVRRLAGVISAALGGLEELKVLSLPFHAFSGEVPPEIWALGKLEVVDFEGNALSGSLHSSFPRGLRVLNLASNMFKGEIPLSISNCGVLETLDLNGNQLNGTIPGFLGRLVNLRELYLSFNQLGGSIPNELGAGCRSLEHLDVSANFLVGSIPRKLGNCRELRSLLLFSNLFDDVLPVELGLLSKLQTLDVSDNCLSGPVPKELGGCIELSVLVLSNPYERMTNYDDKNHVYIDDFNLFQGGIVENITTLPKLRVLWAPRANLNGLLPTNWGSCENLEILNLGGNFFSGSIPGALMECHNIKFLNLSSNKLTGFLNEGLQVPCMDVLDVSSNNLSGSIPKFIPKPCPSSGTHLDHLSSAYISFFTYMSLSSASSVAYDFSIDITQYHNFGGNSFTENLSSLPVSDDRLKKNTVYAFMAAKNNIFGQLSDDFFGKCKDLSGLIINLNDNWISGVLPVELGVICKPLVALSISGNRLAGLIPQSIGLLEGIMNLDLSRNQFQGEIPVSFNKLGNLHSLLLSTNHLNGTIPVVFGQMHGLSVLDLSSNSLSGEIPKGLMDLRNLTVLLLDHNKLSGEIPSGLANMNSLLLFNLSFNNLSGSLPMNASSLGCDSVLENPLISCHVYSLDIPPSDPLGHSGNSQAYADTTEVSPPNSSSGTGFNPIEIASIASAAAIVSVLLVLVVIYVYTQKCTQRVASQPSGSREVNVFMDIGVRITIETVVRATGNFNASNCIGSGGFGATYKAEISPGVVVAIKRLSIGRFQGVQQFHAEIKTLGRWRHPNLVTLIGYHLSESDMFLIYNYLPGGNLERFIQERHRRPVDWRMLHKIAQDVACALAYLHDDCVPRILHRDVKPSNILLDDDYNAYLSDFGLARLLGNSETHVTTGVAGTFGYVAPEYAMTCRVSDKADVYSYGVVLMELISDKKALDPSFSPYGNGFNIVAWACMLLRQGRAREFFTEGLWHVGPHDDLVETLHLAVMCTVDSLSVRPTMKQVVQRLKQLQPPTC